MGTHLLMLFLHFISESQREKSKGEASTKIIDGTKHPPYIKVVKKARDKAK